MTVELIPVSAIVPTRNRSGSFLRTLESLAKQSVQPQEIICVDGSRDVLTHDICEDPPARLRSRLVWKGAKVVGGALQRNEGIAAGTHPFVLFCDDDILFESECLRRLWRAIETDRELGGANAMIVNQRYQPPGLISRTMFAIMNGRFEKSFAGKVIGPAINLLPEDRDDLPEIVPVEWLNLGCTIYRREALPNPPFDDHFTGYSLMEDVALSVRVAQAGWKLANARTARIFHDSQTGIHKSDPRALSCMELTNRYFVMTTILDRRWLKDAVKLGLWECFSLASLIRSRGCSKQLPSVIAGKWDALRRIVG